MEFRKNFSVVFVITCDPSVWCAQVGAARAVIRSVLLEGTSHGGRAWAVSGWIITRRQAVRREWHILFQE